MRFRNFGVTVGTLPTGKRNSISDVSDVLVGHTTLIEGDDVRTGVTAILPHTGNLFTQSVSAAVHTINGFGKAIGFEQVRELGTIETPILLTNTLNIGKVSDALVGYMIEQNPNLRSVNPLVGECNDGYLNNIHKRAVEAQHVRLAIENASENIEEGCVGAGTGTVCYGFKGGIGTASRLIDDYTVGVLVQTNFGATQELQILGVPIGQHLAANDDVPIGKDGSVMIIIATDAPLSSRQLGRLSHRVPFGLGRTGTICHHGSGDFVVAFSTNQAPIIEHDNAPMMNQLFTGVVECVEEAVYNALVAANDIIGFQGRTLKALPKDKLLHWLTYYRRL